MTHTPTPWIFKPGYDNTDGDLTLGSIMGDDMYIARIWNDQEYAENDARFIIKACNAHEELVAALRDLVAANNAVCRARMPGVRESPPDYAPLYESIHRAQAVLTKVEGN